MNNSALIIFAKNFLLAQVKTRLAIHLGEKKALEIYKELLNLTEQTTKNWNGKKYVFWDKSILKGKNFLQSEYEHKIQTGEDLGEKMKNAFYETLQIHSPVCIIGTDCPFLTREILNEAFLSLENFDYCIGPSLDGGYYLLGLNFYNSFWFENIKWSTPEVYPTTLQKAKQLNLNGYILPTLRDIDTIEDYLAWKNFTI
jgi:hypothetical protein